MNAMQLRYQWGRFMSGCGDLVYSAAAPFFAYQAVQAWQMDNAKGVAVNAFCAALIGLKGYAGLMSRISLWQDKKELDTHPGEYCFAESKRIVIRDRKGLEALLEETAKKRWREWGTVLKAHEEREDAAIDKILSREEAAATGIFKYSGLGLMVLNRNHAVKLDFDGIHHYHPRTGSASYSINTLDRAMPEGFINLLTFNTSHGPEVIGYNIRYTYIPAKKDDKSVLVRATPKDIMKYLAG